MALAKIVYASMTGNTEEIADIVAEAFDPTLASLHKNLQSHQEDRHHRMYK